MVKHEIIKNSIYNYIPVMVTMLVGFFSLTYITRLLGVDKYGTLILVISVANVVSNFISFGLAQTISIKICKYGKDDYVSQLFFIKFFYKFQILFIVAAIIIVPIVLFFSLKAGYPSISSSPHIVLILFYAISSSFILPVRAIYGALGWFKTLAIANVLFSLAQNVFLIVVLSFTKEVLVLFGLVAIALFIVGVGFLLLMYIRVSINAKKGVFEIISKVEDELNGLSFMKTSAAFAVQPFIEIILISGGVLFSGLFFGVKYSAIFGVIYKVMSLPQNLLLAISRVMAPSFSRVHHMESSSSVKAYFDISYHLCIIGMMVSIFSFFSAKEIITIVSGSEYSFGSDIFKIFCLYMFMSMMSAFFSLYLDYTGGVMMRTFRMLIAGFFVIVLEFSLGKINPQVTAWCMVFPYCILVSSYLFEIKNRFGFDLLGQFFVHDHKAKLFIIILVAYGSLVNYFYVAHDFNSCIIKFIAVMVSYMAIYLAFYFKSIRLISKR